MDKWRKMRDSNPQEDVAALTSVFWAAAIAI